MDDSPRPRSRHPIFARCYSALAPLSEALGGSSVRRELLRDLQGRVVEVGAGNGLNFAHYPATVELVVAVEPEAHLKARATRAAHRALVPVEVLNATAERLPLEDASCDGAVVSLVLCSVDNQRAALEELFRVVRPGGELRFYEHIRGGRWGGALQDRLDPAWSLIAGGCHLNRDTAAGIAESGFTITRIRRVATRLCGIPVPAPAVILGRARRP